MAQGALPFTSRGYADKERESRTRGRRTSLPPPFFWSCRKRRRRRSRCRHLQPIFFPSLSLSLSCFLSFFFTKLERRSPLHGGTAVCWLCFFLSPGLGVLCLLLSQAGGVVHRAALCWARLRCAVLLAQGSGVPAVPSSLNPRASKAC